VSKPSGKGIGLRLYLLLDAFLLFDALEFESLLIESQFLQVFVLAVLLLLLPTPLLL
jgi:hypothetical protein